MFWGGGKLNNSYKDFLLGSRFHTSVAAVAAVSTFRLRQTQRISSSITSVLSLGRNPVTMGRVWQTTWRKQAGRAVPWAWSTHTITLCPPWVLQVRWAVSVGLEMLQNRQHHRQAPTFKGCYLIPTFNEQSIIWGQKVWENLKTPKFRVSKWLFRLSEQGKDGLINSPSEWKLTALCSVFCPCESRQPADMMFPLILKWGEGSWEHRGLHRSKPLFYWMLHLLTSWWELNNIMLIFPQLTDFSFSLSAALERKHKKCCFLCMNNHFQMPDLSPEPPGKESNSKESVFIYFLLSVPITDRGLWFYSWWQVACISQGWNAKTSQAWRQYQLDATCLSRAIR